jgi:glyoxylase-like metal-dependent hydrolase (beta-lactamase superfamily II)
MSIDAVGMFNTANNQAAMMGFELGDINSEEIKTIMLGDVIEFGNSKIECLDTAGHCIGSLSYYNAEEKYIITGDALFAQSIGRTDLPTGDLDLLLSNIKEKILTLPEETKVYPGHGPYSTVDYERTHNPFLL